MKVLHPPVWQGVVSALQDIFAGGFPADKVIQRQLKFHRKWGSSDRRLFAESVYDIVRWWRRILNVAGESWPMDLTPDLLRKAITVWCEVNQVSVQKDLKSPELNAKLVLARWGASDLPRAVRESMPDWLDERAAAEIGERWNRILPVLNTVAPVYLRANGLKINAAKLRAKFAAENIQAEEAGDDALVLQKRTNVFLSRAFKDGLFEVQDLNSQKVAPALQAKPGERVVDACAGAGGKSLHLAAIMGNKGKVIALDVHEKKLEALRERSTRAGATCIETRLIENNKTIKRLHDSADRLLLDVPCSGLGVIRRNPDSKWKLAPEEVDRVQGIQKEILANYTPILKKGGRLVYSTCSILPSENQGQVEAFLAAHGSQWRLLTQETLWPEAGGPDGFYIAVLEKL